jgi:hypothetical protein
MKIVATLDIPVEDQGFIADKYDCGDGVDLLDYVNTHYESVKVRLVGEPTVTPQLIDAPLPFEDARLSRRHPGVRTKDELSLGERAADRAVTFFGSWPFVIWQTVIVLVWMFLKMIAQRRNAQIASERAEHDHRQLYRIALAMGVEGEL